MPHSATFPELEPLPDSWKPDPLPPDFKKIGGAEDYAYALGGLGGFNNYIGGVLASAIEKDRKPKLISCTSGGIIWAAKYLEACEAGQGDKLKSTNYLKEYAEQAEKSCNLLSPEMRLLNDMILAAFGISGIFKPEWAGRINNLLFHDPSTNLLRWPPSQINITEEIFDRLMPAALMTPTRPEIDFENYAKVFNDSKIGIVFNAFDSQAGKEFLFINEAAVPWINIDTPKEKAQGKTHYHQASNPLKHWKVNAAAVRAALQLFAYGFDWKVRDPVAGIDRVLVDGDYHRQLILSELHRFQKIFAIRPLNEKYITNLPTNYLEVQNLQTTMWLNGAVDAQKEAIILMNRTLKNTSGTVPMIDGRPIHDIDVVDVEVPTTYGFFDYFIENMDTYYAGKKEGDAKL